MRVVGMNEASSTEWDKIPLPARQQLGYKDELVDVDARSGNGLADKVEMVDDGSGVKKPNPGDGGHRVQPVTYHLRPGSQRRTTRKGEGTGTTDNDVTTQREQPGRNERTAAKGDDPQAAKAGSGRAAEVQVTEAAAAGRRRRRDDSG